MRLESLTDAADREAFRARIEKANVLISENRDLRAHIDSLQQDLSVSTGDAARVRQQMLSVRSRMESLETENRQLQREASLLRERETSSRIRVKSSPPGERRQGPTPRSHPPVLMTELRAQNRENKRTSLEPINTESTLTESLRNNLGGASPPSIPPSSTPSVSSFGDMKAADREIETFLRAYDRAAELSWVASVLSRREQGDSQNVVSRTVVDGDKEETRFEDGHFEVVFPSGMRKVIWPDSVVAVLFVNKDIKVSSLSQGKTTYAFANGVLQMTLSDGSVVNSFPDGQVEIRTKENLLAILFPSGFVEVQEL